MTCPRSLRVSCLQPLSIFPGAGPAWEPFSVSAMPPGLWGLSFELIVSLFPQTRILMLSLFCLTLSHLVIISHPPGWVSLSGQLGCLPDYIPTPLLPWSLCTADSLFQGHCLHPSVLLRLFLHHELTSHVSLGKSLQLFDSFFTLTVDTIIPALSLEENSTDDQMRLRKWPFGGIIPMPDFVSKIALKCKFSAKFAQNVVFLNMNPMLVFFLHNFLLCPQRMKAGQQFFPAKPEFTVCGPKGVAKNFTQ